jgi:hypothetical protein
MNDEPGSDIRAGDKVRRRDAPADEVGDVIEVLPFYGSFGSGPDTLLFVVAVVRWKATRQKAVVRVGDLVKLS